MAARKGGPILLKSISPRIRPQATDITAAAMWGVTAAVGALWLVQPFDWIKEKLTAKPEEDQKA